MIIISNSHQPPFPLSEDCRIFYPCFQVDKMEEVAQGRVWTGKDAASQGLVDAIGGFSRAIAIAKQKANIPQDRQVGASSHPTVVSLLIRLASTPMIKEIPYLLPFFQKKKS